MPPDYGIVDGNSFYHIDVVTGTPPSRVGDLVSCDGVPNTDGGKYQWRVIRLKVERALGPAVRSVFGREEGYYVTAYFLLTSAHLSLMLQACCTSTSCACQHHTI
jgi:hypothetical protein